VPSVLAAGTFLHFGQSGAHRSQTSDADVRPGTCHDRTLGVRTDRDNSSGKQTGRSKAAVT
jgi:hypothetical protein